MPQFRITIIQANILALLALITCPQAKSQLMETRADVSGTGIPYRRVRLLTGDKGSPGTTQYYMYNDPFLLYQLGRDLVQRVYTPKDGVYGKGKSDASFAESAQETSVIPRIARDHVNSCASCHSNVFREGGSGQVVASTGGRGRITPHFFGIGALELIAERIRCELHAKYDTNRNGFFDRTEVEGNCPVVVYPDYDHQRVNFGTLTPDADGIPQINSIFKVVFLDSQGVLVDNARSLNDTGVSGFDVIMMPFGWGRGRQYTAVGAVGQGGEAATLREFFADAANVHMGVQTFDPGFTDQSIREPVQGRSPIGATQFSTRSTIDPGKERRGTHKSLDDPDGDGVITELSAGDLDAIEFYLLNVPQPSRMFDNHLGAKIFNDIGCARCHIKDWKIPDKIETTLFSGDRRFFQFDVRHRSDDVNRTELLGTLTVADALKDEDRRSGVIEDVYSDFRHWNIGPAFYERRFDGSVQRMHRTTPLWGAGSTRPYGHSGQFATLNEVILAHAGDAQPESQAFSSLTDANAELLVQFLRSSVLYNTDRISADINGDGVVSKQYEIDGVDVGYERFEPRFLFAIEPKFDMLGFVPSSDGRLLPFMSVKNLRETYGLDHRSRIDNNANGFPDVID